MPLPKPLQAAFRAFSQSQPDIRKSYPLERAVRTIMGKPYYGYHAWDHKVCAGRHEIPVRLFRPQSRGPHKALLFFHGGGWVVGNIDSYTKFCCRLAMITDRLIISVDYRLAPEHPFPEGLLDCYAVARELYTKPELLGLSGQDIVMIGDSAGGNLAAAVSLMARDRGEFLPHAQILIYPATYNDHTAASPFASVRENGEGYLLTSKRICEYMALYERRPSDRLNPYFAPLAAADFSRQPKTLVITAEYDPLRDEGEAYAHALWRAGNDTELHRVPDALHGYFTLSPRVPAVQMTHGIIHRFLAQL